MVKEIFGEGLEEAKPPGYLEGFVDGGVGLYLGAGEATCILVLKSSRVHSEAVLR